jgi:hypothetical protein
MLTFEQEEELILTGPKQGLAPVDAIYVEIDLKTKGAGKHKEGKQLSKGYVEMKSESCMEKVTLLSLCLVRWW